MVRKTILKVKKQFLKSHQSNFKIILVSATTFSLHANSQLQCDYDIIGLILCSFNYLARDKSFMCYKIRLPLSNIKAFCAGNHDL